MSSGGRAENSSGCVAGTKERATGLIGFAAQIRRSSLIGSCAMETAEHREPCASRGSRTVLGAPGGEIPPGDSTNCENLKASKCFPVFVHERTFAGAVGTAEKCQYATKCTATINRQSKGA